MIDFFNNIFNSITIAWHDVLSLLFLIIIICIGFKKGFIKELINLITLVISIFITIVLYERITDILFAILNIETTNYSYSIIFSVIFISLLIIKIRIYNAVKKLTYIDNPCDLNNYLAKMVFWMVITFIAWSYVHHLFNLEIMSKLVENETIRYWLSFAIIFGSILSLVKFTIKLFNIKVNTEQDCLMEYFFSKFLYFLKGINNIINTTVTNNFTNKLLGAITAFIKGLIFIFIIVLVLNSIEFINQQDFWIVPQGILKIFQELNAKINHIISNLLIFVELNELIADSQSVIIGDEQNMIIE